MVAAEGRQLSRAVYLHYTCGPFCAGVAQSVERLTRNEEVGGSIPLAGTIFLPPC